MPDSGGHAGGAGNGGLRRKLPASQAGRFYPASATSLSGRVEQFLSQAVKGTIARPKAVIAPHAGYSYSGPIAGSAFASWLGEGGTIQRIVLLGPSHWVDFTGLALPDAGALSTPLGEIAVDLEAVHALQVQPQVRVFNPAHEGEHSLEVELPFLQAVVRQFTIVPLIVGRATDTEVGVVLEQLWGGDETRFVLSSDLSHYLDYAAARRLDRLTADGIASLSGEALTSQHACGYRAIRAFLSIARAHGLSGEAVDLRNSGDTAGPRDSVVGYGAFAIGARDDGTGTRRD